MDFAFCCCEYKGIRRAGVLDGDGGGTKAEGPNIKEGGIVVVAVVFGCKGGVLVVDDKGKPINPSTCIILPLLVFADDGGDILGVETRCCSSFFSSSSSSVLIVSIKLAELLDRRIPPLPEVC